MSAPALRIAFAGTPDFAAAHLAALLAPTCGHRVVAVWTQPDRPAGRGKQLTSSPVKALAQRHELPVHQPPSLRDPEAQQVLRELAPDVLVVVAYGLILPQAVLDIPRLGCINVHASLLPRWRGAAPIQRAIEAGDTETGVTIMQMDAGLDTGPMLAEARCPIHADDTSASLHDRLAQLGPPCLLASLDDLAVGRARPRPQPEAGACYAAKIDKAEAAIDWRLPAAVLARRIRAFQPFPVCSTTLHGERVKIHGALALADRSDATPGTITGSGREGLTVACGEGNLQITHLQWPGGKVLAVADALNSRAAQLQPGGRFLE